MASRRRRVLLKVIFLGPPRVGKTALLEKITGKPFRDNYKPTIGADFFTLEAEVEDTRVTLQLWDTAGQERFQSLGMAFFRGADVAVFVYNASNPDFEALKGFEELFFSQLTLDEEAKKKFPILLLGTHADLVSSELLKPGEQQQAWLKQHPSARHHFVSGKCDDVQTLLAVMKDIVPTALAREQDTPITPVILSTKLPEPEPEKRFVPAMLTQGAAAVVGTLNEKMKGLEEMEECGESDLNVLFAVGKCAVRHTRASFGLHTATESERNAWLHARGLSPENGGAVCFEVKGTPEQIASLHEAALALEKAVDEVQVVRKDNFFTLIAPTMCLAVLPFLVLFKQIDLALEAGFTEEAKSEEKHQQWLPEAENFAFQSTLHVQSDARLPALLHKNKKRFPLLRVWEALGTARFEFCFRSLKELTAKGGLGKMLALMYYRARKFHKELLPDMTRVAVTMTRQSLDSGVAVFDFLRALASVDNVDIGVQWGDAVATLDVFPLLRDVGVLKGLCAADMEEEEAERLAEEVKEKMEVWKEIEEIPEST